MEGIRRRDLQMTSLGGSDLWKGFRGGRYSLKGFMDDISGQMGLAAGIWKQKGFVNKSRVTMSDRGSLLATVRLPIRTSLLMYNLNNLSLKLELRLCGNNTMKHLQISCNPKTTKKEQHVL